jgi:hypothetical protein
LVKETCYAEFGVGPYFQASVNEKEQLPAEPKSNRPNLAEIGLFLLANLIALSFLYSPGTGDVSIWRNWIDQMSAFGLVGGFVHSGTDYPPLSLIILETVSRCADAFGITVFLALKWSLFLFLITTAASFYWFSRDLILTAALEFSLILNSVALGYLDIYFAPFLIAAFFCLQRGHFTIGVLLFATSCLIKWQPLLIAPFVCIYVLTAAGEGVSGRDKAYKRVVPFVIAAVVVVLPLVMMFGTGAIINSLQRAMSRHNFISGYALNFGWLHTWALHLWAPEKYGSLQNGAIDLIQTRDALLMLPEKILFYLSYAAILIVFALQKKTFRQLIVYSILGYLSYFLFNTGVHENHLFPIACLAWVLVFIDSSQLVRAINLSIAANINLFLFAGVFGQGVRCVIAGVDITLWFALANISLFVGLLLHTLRSDDVGFKFWARQSPPRVTATG